MSSSNRVRSVRRWFALTTDEEVWRSWAISLALSSFLLVVIAIVWMAHSGTLSEAVMRARILSPFSVAWVALITFCTVVWRGLISARQADYQQKQIDNLSKQLAKTEENNLALLLQKGAELLANLDSRAQLGAGVATLQAVIVADNTKFAREAMELLADFIDEKFQHSTKGGLFRSAAKALEAGHERGLVAARTVDFSANETTEEPWAIFPGVEELSYREGKIVGYDDTSAKGRGISIVCIDVTLSHSINLRVDGRFRMCEFHRCKIRGIGLAKAGSAKFVRCDFTDAVLEGSTLSDVEFLDCYYSKEAPPTFPAEWIEKLSILESS